MTHLEQYCNEHNIDVTQVQSLLSFIVSNVSCNPTLREAFLKEPISVIDAGIKQWHSISVNYYNELLNNPVKQSELIESIYFQLKGN